MLFSLVLSTALGLQSEPPITYGLPADFYVVGLREFYPRNA